MSPPAPLPPFALFEDNLSQPASGLLLQQYLQSIDCHEATQVETFFATLEAHIQQGHWIALIANYELGRAFEARVPSRDTRLARALVFAEAISLDEAALTAWWQQSVATLSAQEREAGLLQLSPQLDPANYAIQVQRVLEYIRAGDCYQTNLTFPMTGQYFGHPLALQERLRRTQPVKHGALVCDGEEWLLSRSPELFFERKGSQLVCRPMKGTAPRGNSPDEDVRNAQALQHSEKNRAENLMIVDLIRNDLGRLAQAGGVHVRSLFELEQYATVFQLTSTIEAGPVEAGIGRIFQALFPCGSVTGAPKVRAMQIIHELEDQARGPYCGALGWIGPDGDCSFNVPIRTLRLQAGGNCRMDIGSGIVADSDAASEYDECLTKARFASNDALQLIETLRCEIYPAGNIDKSFPLLAWHLQRLSRSAQALGFRHDEEAVRAALMAHATSLPPGLHRVRLLLSRDGTLALGGAPLDALRAQPTLVLASQRLNPDDLRLQHKTTARNFYDSALREAMVAGHFDLLYLNTRNEVCEGARSNIFIERDGDLLTPPVSSGLLPGVMRAQLLAAGAAREHLLSMADVLDAERIFVGNALRGLVEVKLVDQAGT
ncbi:aminodeoxychorismate synthase component I [Uliginosibacterium sp. H3]|uniref:Aminodeoxychorismate synthase component I n=1 Tax=Uliginosibacterium silvisoli TaxID=3114758 RepID=A0ABU6K332_9RHOO|nr:aminodeoxychorismate synthase component I [Uliginosibacterium sp. H3]